MASEYLKKKAAEARARKAEAAKAGSDPALASQTYTHTKLKDPQPLPQAPEKKQAAPSPTLPTLASPTYSGRLSGHGMNIASDTASLAAAREHEKIPKAPPAPYIPTYSGRLSGHGMNLSDEEYRLSVQEQEDVGRRWGAGIASIPVAIRGTVPSLIETGQQMRANSRANRQNEAWLKQKEIVDPLAAKEYHGRLEYQGGIESQNTKSLNIQRAALEAVSDHTPVDQSKYGQTLMAHSRELQRQATEGLPWGERFLANTAISIGTNLPSLAVSAINPSVGLGMMGTLAAAQKTSGLNERSVSPGEALSRGIVAGGIEILTERIPLHSLMDIIKTGGGKSIVKTMLKQSGTEATEEAAAYILNFIADEAVGDPNSKWSWMELLESAGMGAVSGGVMSAGAMAISGGEVATTLEEQGVAPEAAARQGELIASVLDGTPISGNEAAVIAKSPQAVAVLSELSGQEINADAPLSEIKKAIKALPPAQQQKTAQETVLPSGPTIQLPGQSQQQLPPARQQRTAQGTKIPSGPTIAMPGTVEAQTQETPYPTNAIQGALSAFGQYGQKAAAKHYDGTVAPDVFFTDFAKHYNDGQHGVEFAGSEGVRGALSLETAYTAWASGQNDAAVNYAAQETPKTAEAPVAATPVAKPPLAKPITKPAPTATPVAVIPATPSGSDTTVGTKADVPAYTKTLSRGTANVFRKWAANEINEIDLADASDSCVQSYMDFFKKWFEAGKAGTRTIDVPQDEIDLDYPPFLQDTFYNEGKKIAAKEAEKAAKKAEKEKGAVKDGEEISTDAGGTSGTTVSWEGDRGALEGVATEDVQGAGEVGQAAPDDGRDGTPIVGGTDGHDAGGDVGGRSLGSGETADIPAPGAVTPEAETPEQEAVADEVEIKQEQAATANPKGDNFVIGSSLRLPSGDKARFNSNLAAIKTVKKLMAEDRPATADEQTILSKYVGWGGLSSVFSEKSEKWAKEFKKLKDVLTQGEYESARASTLNAHFTSIPVIKAMYDGLQGLGFTGGRMLEPSSGVGNFVGAMPNEMTSTVKSWSMVELDTITGNIAKHLYPNADVRVQGFEKATFPDDLMDVAIGNVPFGNISVIDKAYPNSVTGSIHNYFFAKTLDKVRPGGIVMFITSRGTLDSAGDGVRKYISERADLLGAIRLPNTAFKEVAGTEVISDIIILKKRESGTDYAGESFLSSAQTDIGGAGFVKTNEYFRTHPEMLLGIASLEGKSEYGKALTYHPLPGNLDTQIKRAFKKIKGTMDYPSKPSVESVNLEATKAASENKEGGHVIKDGKIYVSQLGKLVERKLSTKDVKRVTDALSIRSTARDLLNAQRDGKPAPEISKLRKKLGKDYDAFAKEFGYLNNVKNKRLLHDDPDYAFISALETYDKETKTGSKADIFTTNTVAKRVTTTHVDSASEGLVVSINETGVVDLGMISKLSGLTQEVIAEQLSTADMIFKNRDGAYETAEQYLSGNVKAKLREAEELVLIDKAYQRNVHALTKIIPEDIPHQSIYVVPGATWVPTSVYEQFAAKMTGTYYNPNSKPVTIKHNAILGQFNLEISAMAKNTVENTQEWGTVDKPFTKIFEAVLNNKSLRVTKKDADGKDYIDKNATIAANEKAEAVKAEFQRWLWEDDHRTRTLAKLYNDLHNNAVNPHYDGTNLTVDGANSEKPLRAHQKDAVQRIIASGGNTLIAHEVGAGKTAEMAAAAMKLRQLGIIKKPMFVVPKSLVAQWGKEFLDFFPAAKILVAGEHDTEKKNRRAFTNRVATGDYDAVIISYESFKSVPMSAESQEKFLMEQIRELESAIESGEGRDPSVKQMEKKKKNLEAKIAALGDMKKDADNIDFESLGVDSVFVDEAHNYKNLFYTTNMNNVSGLGNKNGSQRSFDLYSKVRWLQNLNGGRGVVFATATPVMNSMSEMYIMQKYLQYDLLKQHGLTSFDAWAKQFGEVVNVLEVKPSGKGHRQKESFSRFKNLPELMQLFHGFADVLIDVPGVKVPNVTRHTIVAQPSPFVTAYIDELEKRAEAVSKGQVDASVDNMLKITSDGRKASYTQRMIDPSLPYEEGSKISMCIDKTFDVWTSTQATSSTQLIFCDMATPKGTDKKASAEAPEGAAETEEDAGNISIYAAIKKQLVLKGIPANEIAFIHDANTQMRKEKLFADVNAGKVRVLLGSTGKMGVGMNAQKKIIALHHLDSPWRPGDVKQQEGRMVRQGNENDDVDIYTYVTEGTFDARMWDGLERKAKFINAVMSGQSDAREIEDVGEQSISFAEIKALASGDPLLQEQVEVSSELQKLSAMKSEHARSIQRAQSKLKATIAAIAAGETRVENLGKDAKAKADVTGDKFTMTVGGKTITDRTKAGTAIIKEAKRVAKAPATENVVETVGTFAGFDITVNNTGDLHVVGAMSHPATLNVESDAGTVQSLEAAVRTIETRLSNSQTILTGDKANVAKLEKAISAPFQKQDRLTKLMARNNEIMEQLAPKEVMSADADEETDDYTDVENMASGEGEGAEKWKADRVGSQTKAPMSVSDIIAKIRYDFGIPVTTGHIRGSKVLGQYANKAQGIRSKIANDLPTVAHELGHHLDNKHALTKGLPSTEKAELEGGLTPGMKAAYKESKWKTEGLAEFIRQYLQNSETAVIDYSKFSAYFRDKLSESDLELVDTIADEINAYYSLDADTAASAIRLREEAGPDFRSHAEKLKDHGDQFYQDWVDANHGIQMFDRAAGSDTYKLASNSAYSDAVAYALLTEELTNKDGKRVGEGLFAALDDVNIKDKKEYRAFGEYLVVKHGPERLSEGMRVFADPRKNSTNWMMNRQRELEEQYPKFKGASEKLYKFQKTFLHTWGIETGLVSHDNEKEWAERWEFYVPFNRSLPKKGGVAAGVKRGFANQTSTIKRAIGSGLDFVHPVDNIVNNLVTMVTAGTRNGVMAEISKAAGNMEGSAVFMEKVPMPLKKKAVGTQGLKEEARQATFDAGLSKSAEDKVFDIIEGLDDILVQYGRGQAHGDVITVLRNGKQEYWKINDPMLLASITNMSPQRLPAWLEVYGRMSKFITMNLTGTNIVWSLFSNFPRDMMTYFTYSTDRNPLKMLSGIGAAYLNKLKPNKQDPLYKEYIAMGGGRTSVYTADINLTKKIRNKMSGNKLDWINPLAWVEFVADAVELGPRFSYYKILRNNGFDTQEAFYGSTDITVNFRRGGTNSKTLNNVIPFYNASVQGLDKFARWISAADVKGEGKAKVVRGRTGGLFAASLALAALSWGINSSDDDKKKEYAQLSNFTKNNYWCTPMGDGKYFAIPKPRELGALSSLMETSMEFFANDNEYAFDEFYDYLTEMTLPNVVSDVAKGDLYGAIGSLGIVGAGAYMMANRNFLGHPIVSESLKQLKSKDQYTQRTSKIAKAMGQAFNVSPQMTDFFFQQTLGGWWKTQKALFPVGSENIDLTLGVQNTYVKDNLYSTDISNRLYDGSQTANQNKNSNPDDMEAAVKAKWYSFMTSFYSNYSKIAKDEGDTDVAQSTRQTVLNMVMDFQKNMDSGYKTRGQQAVEEISAKTGDTKYLPGAVSGVIKDDDGVSYKLTASQYVEYQTEYLGFYWNNVQTSLKRNANSKTAEAVLSKAKYKAAADAKARALQRRGAVTIDYTETKEMERAGVAPWESILYDVAYRAAKNEKKSGGNSKQENVIEALDAMTWLTDAERAVLFGSTYKSATNNPYY